MVSNIAARYGRRIALFAMTAAEVVGVLAAIMPVRPALAAPVNQTLLTSSSGSLQTRWYSLRGYGTIRSQVNWPLRSEGCPANGVAYKTSPWQPAYGPFDGNTFNLSSNCFDRYTDAGTSPYGAWIQGGGALGSWSTGGGASYWTPRGYPAFSNVMGGCGNIGNPAGIWGVPGPDLSDQFYQAGGIGTVPGTANGLFRQQYGTAAQATNLYSNGVTLVRDSFNLSSVDMARLGQGSTSLVLQAYADDWLRVYVNGALSSYSVSTTGKVTLDLNAAKGLLHAGQNWLGVMVADKAIFDTVDPGGRGSGVCYNLQYQYDTASFPPYNLTPGITDTVNGVTPPGNVVQVGDPVIFTYSINNPTAGISDPVTSCRTYAQTFPGYHPAVAGGEVLSGGGPGTSCPTVLLPNTRQDIATEPITAAAGNTTICRSLYISPSATGGGTAGYEDCVFVAAKPYVKVFGGDAAAGLAFSGGGTNTCTNPNNPNAQIISWNKESAGYAGSGAQYAALALSTITDFASNQNGAGASAPSSLAFANTTTSGASIFGGSFGTPNMCIPNYYGTMPTSGTTSLSASTDVSLLTSGAYTSAGGVQLTGGIINPGNRIQLFVKGDVYISGDIAYAGSWSADKMPLFQLVTTGNIYILNTVTQLDGAYISQPSGATGGTIYTCATGPGTPVSTGSGTYFATCNNKLAVNGSLVGNQIQLLRTSGTLGSSGTGDTPASNAAAESINYSPALWIAQPTSTSASTSASYDAINSLPPVL